MQYLDARPLIKSGDVLFWSHKPVRSWYDFKIALVRAFTRSEWSHVGLAWKVGQEMFVLEAVSSGVRIFRLSQAGDFTWISRAGFTKRHEAFALSCVGQPYSQWDALLAFFGASRGDNGWSCSEYVVDTLKLPIKEKTPAKVMQYLLEFEDLQARFVKSTEQE